MKQIRWAHKVRCKNCKIKFSPLYSSKGKFCNSKCKGKFTRRETLKRDLILFNKGKLHDRTAIKNVLLIRRKRKCEICKRKKWNGKPIVLWLDHRDGNAGNHKRTNVRLLCLNCDSQTPTFGSKNIGYGRKSRGLSLS